MAAEGARLANLRQPPLNNTMMGVLKGAAEYHGLTLDTPKEGPVNFYTIERMEPVARQAAVLASLDYAVDKRTNPAAHSSQAYGVGPRAYDNRMAAVPTGGPSHGNWWSATVWSECRRMAAGYLSAIAGDNTDVAGRCAQPWGGGGCASRAMATACSCGGGGFC